MALSDEDLQLAAQALRAFSRQTEEQARQLENPSLRQPLTTTAMRAAELAERFERARKARKGAS